MTYFEKLKSPHWQKKRLEILNRDQFTCQQCGEKESPLHVHHKNYVFGKDPWDYPNDNLITLCKSCHSKEEISKERFNDLVHDLLMMGHSYIVLESLLRQHLLKDYAEHI